MYQLPTLFFARFIYEFEEYFLFFRSSECRTKLDRAIISVINNDFSSFDFLLSNFLWTPGVGEEVESGVTVAGRWAQQWK